MKIRNAMCIFALFSIMALFFCFGVVANAAEDTDTEQETYSYNLSYDLKGRKVGNYKNTKFTIDGLSNLPYRMVGIKGLSNVYDEGTDNAFIAYDVTFYYLVNDNLSLFSNNGLHVNRSAVKTKWNDTELTSSDTITLSTISCSSIMTNIPIFDNDEAGKAAALSYLKTGELPKEIYDNTMDAPKLSFTEKGGLTFVISNSVDAYSVEMQGRNYTVDDVELYKENAVWKYRYNTILKNELTTWIAKDSDVSSTETFNLFTYGKASVSDLNSKYPVDNRTYTGGKNALGNYFSGYSSALSQFKSLCQTQGSLYCGTEIYIRFVYKDSNGDTHYSKWTHWFDNLGNSNGSSGSKIDDKNNVDNGNHSDVGLTDEEKKKLEDSDNSRNDTDTKPIRIEPTSPIDGVFKDFNPTNILTYFVSLIKTLLSATSNIAPFFNNIFGFLPVELRNVVYVTISAGCFCALIRFIFGKG